MAPPTRERESPRAMRKPRVVRGATPKTGGHEDSKVYRIAGPPFRFD